MIISLVNLTLVRQRDDERKCRSQVLSIYIMIHCIVPALPAVIYRNKFSAHRFHARVVEHGDELIRHFSASQYQISP